MKLLGSVAQACPTCGVTLPKMPARKTKCKHCSAYFYVRTRPQDHLRVLLTEDDARALEAQWIQYEDDKPRINPRPEAVLLRVRTALEATFGRPPSDQDVLWRVFNEELLEFSQSESWALYTHTTFEMAELLFARENKVGALELYIQAFHLMANGPRNIDRELVRSGYSRFSSQGFLPEQYIKRLLKAKVSLGISDRELQEKFVTTASRVTSELMLPLAAEHSWLLPAAHIPHDA